MAIRWEPASEEELARRVTAAVRAREGEGKFKADNPLTPQNEAWVGEKPKRKRKAKE
jgi:hypothetical protein